MAAALVGIGSSVFHPEASRVARMASGGRYGLAQSLFQVGGSTGSAIGPLLAAFIVVPHGQASIAWFSLVALLAIVLLTRSASGTAATPRSRSPAAAARAVGPAALAARQDGWSPSPCWWRCCSPRTSTPPA